MLRFPITPNSFNIWDTKITVSDENYFVFKALLMKKCPTLLDSEKRKHLEKFDGYSQMFKFLLNYCYHDEIMINFIGENDELLLLRRCIQLLQWLRMVEHKDMKLIAALLGTIENHLNHETVVSVLLQVSELEESDFDKINRHPVGYLCIEFLVTAIHQLKVRNITNLESISHFLPSILKYREQSYQSDSVYANVVECSLARFGISPTTSALILPSLSTKTQKNSLPTSDNQSFTIHKNPPSSISELFNDDSTSDVSLKFGNKIVHAHRTVLCLVSDFFKVMFCGNFDDSSVSCVDMRDTFFIEDMNCPSETLQEDFFLLFIESIYHLKLKIRSEHSTLQLCYVIHLGKKLQLSMDHFPLVKAAVKMLKSKHLDVKKSALNSSDIINNSNMSGTERFIQASQTIHPSTITSSNTSTNAYTSQSLSSSSGLKDLLLIVHELYDKYDDLKSELDDKCLQIASDRLLDFSEQQLRSMEDKFFREITMRYIEQQRNAKQNQFQ